MESQFKEFHVKNALVLVLMATILLVRVHMITIQGMKYVTAYQVIWDKIVRFVRIFIMVTLFPLVAHVDPVNAMATLTQMIQRAVIQKQVKFAKSKVIDIK